jgi:hypothetical protein
MMAMTIRLMILPSKDYAVQDFPVGITLVIRHGCMHLQGQAIDSIQGQEYRCAVFHLLNHLTDEGRKF